MTDRQGQEERDDRGPPEEPDEARRAALAKMGRFAGYTAPVMLGLLGATKARAEVRSSPEPCPS